MGGIQQAQTVLLPEVVQHHTANFHNWLLKLCCIVPYQTQPPEML